MNISPTSRESDNPQRNQKNSQETSQRWQFAFFVMMHILIFTALFHTIFQIKFSATGLYLDYANNIFNGQVPYRDFSLEYPPFALFFFLLPRLGVAPGDWAHYSIYYQTEVVIFDLIGLFLIYLIARKLGKAPWIMMAVYTVGVLAIGPIIGQQYDIFPAVMTLAAIYFFTSDKHKTAWVLLALGTLTKLFPAFIAPIFLIVYLRNRQYRLIWTGIITFAVTTLVILLPFLILGPSSLMVLINYQGDRGIQLESTYSAILMVADKLHFIKLQPSVFNFGSWNLAGHAADLLAKLSTYILAVLLLIAYWFIYHETKPGKSQFTRIGGYALLVILIALFASKVLSPQYLMWLIPLVPLLFGSWRYTVVVLVAVGALTYYIFPLYYENLINFVPSAVAALFLRDILLIIMALLTVISLRSMKPSD